MSAEFIVNPNLIEELSADPDILGQLLDIGLEIAGSVTGAEIHRYGSETDAWIEGDHVVVARLEPFAPIDEYGTAHLPPSAALRNAIRSVDGLTFVENGP